MPASRDQISLALGGVWDVNCAVIKHAFAALLGTVALCSPLAAQVHGDVITGTELEQSGAIDAGPALTLARSNLFSGVDGSLLLHSLPVLTLLDGRRFPISSELGRMGMVELPVAFLSAVEVQRPGGSPRYGSDASGGLVNIGLKRLYTGGEVGFFYGRSDGKYGREDFHAHIIGGIGTDKFNITVGAAFHESEVTVPRNPRRR